ncbi:MAG: hypothetical protein KC544_02005 [Gemmatimonadetes bacterium]|nr:hypothetical protein [Gemmatimonadota bacterium]MCA9761885.1 hypothetical protein [Gemmatimonadota bacterium]MCB9504766.1 hypothetical protein [Gemmatimonadales bacterium]HPF63051.1 hypothetical protein [Gemmatimonadales bacterium]HRX19680.1 hypothetical protein [Gemmatimonadales bacterium]
MWPSERPVVTAEWLCTRCSTSNRKLVPVGTRSVTDRCLHCGLRHTVTPGDRPVRWQAEAA